jgi:hypothetical protein
MTAAGGRRLRLDPKTRYDDCLRRRSNSAVEITDSWPVWAGFAAQEHPPPQPLFLACNVRQIWRSKYPAAAITSSSATIN